MSKKAFAVFILLIIATAVLAGWYFVYRTDNPAIPADTGSEPTDLFPFGKRPAEPDSGELVTEPDDDASVIDLGGSGGDEILPRLRQISATPAAGAVVFGNGSTTLFRFVERATGHIYEASSDSSGLSKISNTTIPKVHEALWSNDGKQIIIRYIKDDTSVLRTFYARISSTTKPEQAIEGIFLPDDIRDVSVSGTKLFYFTETANGSTGILSNMDGSSKTSPFISSFNDWRGILSSPGYAVVFSRPSGNSDGSLYFLNTSSGSFTKVSSGQGIAGLGNPDNSLAIFSTMVNRRLISSVFDAKKGTISDLGLSTLADKCAWSPKNKTVVYCAVPNSLPSGTYPDDWYKGKISFSDGLWKIDTANGETENIFEPGLEAGISMDIFKLSLDKEERFIVFTDKKSMLIWSYSLVD